jgi:DNA phosphorothioation-associated DGQHR protein 1
MIQFPIEVKALRVVQPIGEYYVAVLPANVLLEVAYSDVLSARSGLDGRPYELEGTQRLVQKQRLQSITDYINRTDAAFPNAVIVAANFRQEDGLIEDDESDSSEQAVYKINKRWTVEESNDGCYVLRIPTSSKLAAIIDGQHRLYAFANARLERLEMNLVCSIFLDLPKPYQAQLFATINSTQKRVDKSLTYELFGYNIEEENEKFWSPDKLAVFLTRRLFTDTDSPLKGKIVIAPKKDGALTHLSQDASWKVSTAVVVEGIMRLYTSNPKKDTTNLLDGNRKERTALKEMRNDRSPLREAYLNTQDKVIYKMTLNFLLACDQVFWQRAQQNSYITKTVGVQALFDVFRMIAGDSYQSQNISINYFINRFGVAQDIDFSIDTYRNASGSGRTTIKNALVSAMGLD